MTIALICAINSEVSGSSNSSLVKLFGDPDDYAYKFVNDTFADELPIHMNRFSFRMYHFFHSISIDYRQHLVYYSNKAHARLEYGWFVHVNDSSSYYFGDAPNSNQVSKP